MLRNLWWVRHIAKMGKPRYIQNIGKESHSEDAIWRRDGRIMLKYML